MSENTSLKNTTAVTEVAASWNTKYVTPDGFVCQLSNLIVAGTISTAILAVSRRTVFTRTRPTHREGLRSPRQNFYRGW
jgi:hypothetical protein